MKKRFLFILILFISTFASAQVRFVIYPAPPFAVGIAGYMGKAEISVEALAKAEGLVAEESNDPKASVKVISFAMVIKNAAGKTTYARTVAGAAFNDAMKEQLKNIQPGATLQLKK